MPVEIWAQYGTTGLLILFTTALLATLRAIYERERLDLRADLIETKTLLATSTESNRTALVTISNLSENVAVLKADLANLKVESKADISRLLERVEGLMRQVERIEPPHRNRQAP